MLSSAFIAAGGRLRKWTRWGVLFGVLSGMSSTLDAQDGAATPPSSRVALVRVHLPLVGNADVALQSVLQRTCDRLIAAARHRKDERRPILVLQLDPPVVLEGEGTRSQFERAFALARFLCSRQMSGVKTIAFLPHSMRRHATLLPLALE